MAVHPVHVAVTFPGHNDDGGYRAHVEQGEEMGGLTIVGLLVCLALLALGSRSAGDSRLHR